MKIGLSYSRCILDIVEDRVDINDVLVVVARTDFDPHDDAQWKGIWQGYGGGSDANLMRGFFGGSNPEWAGHTDEDEEEFRNVSKELWDLGKFHQPRKFGARPRRLPYHWLETIVPSEELESRPAVKDAWDQFQIISGLANTPLKAHNE
jgi:hypothetical protein